MCAWLSHQPPILAGCACNKDVWNHNRGDTYGTLYVRRTYCWGRVVLVAVVLLGELGLRGEGWEVKGGRVKGI